VEVREAVTLKPINIILCISYSLDILTLIAGGILVLKCEKISVILYLLGIDIIIMIILTWIIFLYTLIADKPA
jgi:hypothetical protein